MQMVQKGSVFDFFAEDLAASASLASAVDRTKQPAAAQGLYAAL